MIKRCVNKATKKGALPKRLLFETKSCLGLFRERVGLEDLNYFRQAF